MKTQVLAAGFKVIGLSDSEAISNTQAVLMGDELGVGFTVGQWENFQRVVGAFMPAHHVVETAPDFVFVVFNF